MTEQIVKKKRSACTSVSDTSDTRPVEPNIWSAGLGLPLPRISFIAASFGRGNAAMPMRRLHRELKG